MKVAFFAADNGACMLYRGLYPAEVCAPAIEVSIRKTHDAWHHPQADGSVRVEPAALEADLAVFQRPASREILELIQGLQKRGTPVVVDVDDDFAALHLQHPGQRFLEPAHNSEINHQWAKRCCETADLVTVTTPALASRYAEHGRVALLPNCVPAALLDVPHGSDGRTLGWAGLAIWHPGDLETVQGGVAEALRGSDWKFRVVGEPTDIKKRLCLDDEPQATGFVAIGDYYRAIGGLDLAIVPLAATPFNEAKSRLKGLECAAMGVPFVASPTPEYQGLAREGIGRLAGDRGRHWKAALLALMNDPEGRREAAEKAREVVRERHTYEGNAERWAAAWQTAVGSRAPVC